MSNTYQKRLDYYVQKLESVYVKVYKEHGAKKRDFESLLTMMKSRYLERHERLQKLDERNKKWYMSRKMIGYTLYTNLFSTSLRNLTKKIPYLEELGITYIQLMPILKPREGENDGGYAVEDYLKINPTLGTMKDFEYVIEKFAEAGIDVCIDYAINHTADTHKWAKKAMTGDPTYQNMYIMYDDRKIPDSFDKTVPFVLPNKYPGNFTYKKEIDKWVFTSFSEFQWDLNFKNPYVFEQMVNILLKLANKGINMIRLDAIPFMWKEEGTSCRNLPQIHDLLHMIHIIKEIVCPSLAILGEAIVQPDEIVKYFGAKNGIECGILYNANFMVNIWNAFATRDVRLLNIDNSKYHIHSQGCWMNYARCHDDIGWGFNEDAIRSFGLDAFYHKQFLIEFYSNQFPGSFAKGENYQYNAQSKDARTNGTMASLLGLEKAVDEKYIYEQGIALRRIHLAHAMILSHRGIPLLYSGDELATMNDQSYKLDDEKKGDGRWIHRPYFDWKRAAKRTVADTFESTTFTALQKMINIRKKYSIFDGDIDAKVIENSDISVYSFKKQKGRQTIIFINNFSEHIKEISAEPYHKLGIHDQMIDLLSGRIVCFDKNIRLAPYEVLWLK